MKHSALAFLLILAGSAFGCARSVVARQDAAPADLGRLRDDRIDEASGLAASRRNPGILWTHNDSGDTNRLFAIDLEGRTVALVTVEGAGSRDWEDMAAATVAGRPMLYVGDIGDNESKRRSVRVYRMAEPAIPAVGDPVRVAELTSGRVDTITLRYPLGARNAETLLVDPASGDVIIVTKGSAAPEVYRASVPRSGDASVDLRLVGRLEMDPIPFGEDNIEGGVAGDVSADGRFVLVKSYLRVYRWDWDSSREMPFVGTALPLPYVPEPQGEAIAVSTDLGTYYTVSEKVGDRVPRLYAYRLQ